MRQRSSSLFCPTPLSSSLLLPYVPARSFTHRHSLPSFLSSFLLRGALFNSSSHGVCYTNDLSPSPPSPLPPLPDTSRLWNHSAAAVCGPSCFTQQQQQQQQQQQHRATAIYAQRKRAKVSATPVPPPLPRLALTLFFYISGLVKASLRIQCSFPNAERGLYNWGVAAEQFLTGPKQSSFLSLFFSFLVTPGDERRRDGLGWG